MAVIVYYLSPTFNVWLALSFVEQVTQLLICIVCGITSYLVCLLLLGIRLSDMKVAGKPSN